MLQRGPGVESMPNLPRVETTPAGVGMTPDELADGQRLLAAATPEPWDDQ